MHKAIRTAAAVCFLAIATPSWVNATSFSTNQSDLWWNPAESGWGIQFVQEADVIFATLFVYDQTRVPIWYTATLNYAGNLTWTGALYLTNGPWFGAGFFDPSSVGVQQVGTMTAYFPFVDSGTLSYSVNGVVVNKSITRQLLRLEDFTGDYIGGIEETLAGCANPANNGAVEDFAFITVNHVGTSMSIVTSDATGFSCTFNGVYGQAGHMGQLTGSFSCSNGDQGNFNAFEMEVSRSGFTARFTGNDIFCSSISGRIGGLRRSAD